MPLVRVQRRWALVVAVIGMPRAVPTAAADSGRRVLGFATLAGMIPRHGGAVWCNGMVSRPCCVKTRSPA